MEQVVPWSGLQSLVEPRYAKAGNGRRPVGLGIMLRTYFVQQWFNLSDHGVEEALYESAALRRFVGVDLGIAPAPDETTICRFRHLLEKHDLGGLMLEAVNVHREAKSICIRDRHNRRCDHHSRAFVDQERQRRARPGDAPDPRSGRSASGGQKTAAPTLQIRSRTNYFRHRQWKTPQHQAPVRRRRPIKHLRWGTLGQKAEISNS
jgi:hypothetical protein